MKKYIATFFALALMIVTAQPCSAERVVCEWENDNAVSFSAVNYQKSNALAFCIVNYATADGKHEYWMRIIGSKHKNKILHWISIFIDGEEYKIKALENPSYKHDLACSSIYRDTWISLNQTIPRYYPLSKEIINKMMKAKEMYIVYHLQSSINRTVKYTDRDLEQIREAMPCTFSDINKFWNPVDKAEQ